MTERAGAREGVAVPVATRCSRVRHSWRGTKGATPDTRSRVMMRSMFAATLVALLSMLPSAAAAQNPTPDDDPDRDINFSQPDFSVITLPTTLRVPKYKSA